MAFVIYVRWVFLFTLIYLALTSNFQLSNIIVGALLGTAVVGLVRPDTRPTTRRNVWRTAIAIVRYIISMIDDLVRSGIMATRIVLSRVLPINPGIVAIPTGRMTDRGQAFAAHLITLTPCEIVVEIGDDGMMYTHFLDATRGDAHVVEALRLQHELLDDIFPY